MRELDLARKIELCVGRTKTLYVDLASFPWRAVFEKISNYKIIISPHGYKLLREKKAVCDRTGGPSRVNIYVRY